MENYFKLMEPKINYSGNTIVDKSFDFSVRIVKFYKFSVTNNKNFEPILKQLLRSGTSIGANISEAQEASSTKDFINKLNISLKESKETEYWLKVFFKSEIIYKNTFNSLHSDLMEIIKILVKIIKTTKENSNK